MPALCWTGCNFPCRAGAVYDPLGRRIEPQERIGPSGGEKIAGRYHERLHCLADAGRGELKDYRDQFARQARLLALMYNI